MAGEVDEDVDVVSKDLLGHLGIAVEQDIMPVRGLGADGRGDFVLAAHHRITVHLEGGAVVLLHPIAQQVADRVAAKVARYISDAQATLRIAVVGRVAEGRRRLCGDVLLEQGLHGRMTGVDLGAAQLGHVGRVEANVRLHGRHLRVYRQGAFEVFDGLGMAATGAEAAGQGGQRGDIGRLPVEDLGAGRLGGEQVPLRVLSGGQPSHPLHALALGRDLSADKIQHLGQTKGLAEQGGQGEVRLGAGGVAFQGAAEGLDGGARLAGMEQDIA